MKTNTLKKIIFSIIVVIGLLAVDIIFIINTNKAVERISELKKEVYKESVLINDINETKGKMSGLQNVQQRVDDLIIEEAEVVSFIGLIEELSGQNNLEIDVNRVDFVEPESEDKLGSLQMSFQVRGSWANVTNFIGDVESIKYLINIESLRMSAFATEGGVGWSANFSLIGFTK
jgi:Tfp pilus assembly protein PilO